MALAQSNAVTSDTFALFSRMWTYLPATTLSNRRLISPPTPEPNMRAGRTTTSGMPAARAASANSRSILALERPTPVEAHSGLVSSTPSPASAL